MGKNTNSVTIWTNHHIAGTVLLHKWLNLLYFQVFSVVLAHRRFSGFLLCLKKKHLCLHVLGPLFPHLKRGAWISFLQSPYSHWVSKYLWFYESWQMVLWEIKTSRMERKKMATKPFCLRLRTCIWICSCRGKLLSGVLQIPRKPGGWKEAWALIISDGRWETFSLCL